MTQLFEPDEDVSLNAVWAWFEFQQQLLNRERSLVLAVLFNHVIPTVHITYAVDPQLTGMTRREVDEFFDRQHGRLDLLTMFDLLATAEAILRHEFRARVQARRKDPLSRSFRDIYARSGQHIRLEDLLDALKAHGVAAKVVANFRGVLKLRHWLAHGKHWHPKLGRGYLPGDVFDIAQALLDALPRL